MRTKGNVCSWESVLLALLVPSSHPEACFSLPLMPASQILQSAMVGQGITLEIDISTICDNSTAAPPSNASPPVSGRRTLLLVAGTCPDPSALIVAKLVLKASTSADLTATIARLYALLSEANNATGNLGACTPLSTSGEKQSVPPILITRVTAFSATMPAATSLFCSHSNSATAPFLLQARAGSTQSLR